jgi:hypothetical protein
MSTFDQAFENCQLRHTGQYTGDNKKIYQVVPSGQHLSKNKQQLVDIKTMAKPYLKNAFLKIWNNEAIEMEDIFNTPSCEEYQLLEAYFTFDIRQKLQNL